MARFIPCSYKYENMRGGDLCFSHDCSITGAIIRLGESVPIGDLSQPNHVFPAYETRDQFFAAELTPRGPDLNSMDLYRGKKNQVIAVYRWNEFSANLALREESMGYLAYWMRKKQDSGYNFIKAVRSSKWVRDMFPWLHSHSSTEICSEDSAKFLRRFGCPLPIAWEKEPPNPVDLLRFIQASSAFTCVLNYKEIS